MAVFDIQTKRVRLSKDAKSALSDYLANRLSSSEVLRGLSRKGLLIGATDLGRQRPGVIPHR